MSNEDIQNYFNVRLYIKVEEILKYFLLLMINLPYFNNTPKITGILMAKSMSHNVYQEQRWTGRLDQ